MDTTAIENPEAIVSTIIHVNETHQASIVTIGGRPSVAIVPLSDLELLRELEDRIDMEAIRRADAEGGEIPIDEVWDSLLGK